MCQLWLKDLIERRENIRLLNDETSMKLKKQVYLNYRQFIEAAREISALESEMFRINHILQPLVQYLPREIFSSPISSKEQKANEVLPRSSRREP